MIVSTIAAAAVCNGCLQDRVVDVVLTGDFAVDLHHDERNVARDIPTIVGVPDELAAFVTDNGYSIDDIESVHIASIAYGTSDLEGGHDWVITGDVQVQRTDGVLAGPAQTVLVYSEQSVEEASGGRIVVPMHEGGAAVLNDALDDFVAGESPILEFRIENHEASPSPTFVDPMVFDLQLWVELQAILKVKTRVIDPF